MSMHRIPLTPLEDEGLRVHGLDIGTPSQLSDAFRLGVAWALRSENHGLPSCPTGQVYGIIDPEYGRAYTMIRKLAWEEGYAIGLHGSFTRDLDLIAVPWAEKPCEPEHLIRRVLQATGLKNQHGNPGIKQHGRLVWTLIFPEFSDPRFIDLSILTATSKGGA